MKTHGEKQCFALIGFRGCGKTTAGRELARLLGGECVDTDDLVAERAGRSIADIFVNDAEVGFRKMESEVIGEVVQAPPAVISVGGGAVLNQRNVEDLRAVATVVWLTAPADVLYQRISTDSETQHSRPPLTQQSGIEDVRRLLAERSPIYQRASDFQIETVDREPGEIAEEIVRCVRPPSSSQARG